MSIEKKRTSKRRGKRPPVPPDHSGREWFREFFGEEYLRAYGLRNRREAPGEARIIEAAMGMTASGTYLDLCCGEGRHAVLLGERGYRIVGLDLSAPLLQAGRRSAARAGLPVEWVRADSRSIPFRGRFAGIYCWFTTFGYFQNRADDRKVLSEAAGALREGGVFLLEVLNREFLLLNRLEEKRIDGEGCYLISRMEFSPGASIATTHKVIHFPRGATRRYRLTVRIYAREQLRKMIASAGFRRIEFLDGIGSAGGNGGSPLRLLRIRALAGKIAGKPVDSRPALGDPSSQAGGGAVEDDRLDPG